MSREASTVQIVSFEDHHLPIGHLSDLCRQSTDLFALGDYGGNPWGLDVRDRSKDDWWGA